MLIFIRPIKSQQCVCKHPKLYLARFPSVLVYVIVFSISHPLLIQKVFRNQDSSMASEIKRIRKPKPLPLARSLQLIAEERVNVARRTRERIAIIGSDSEYDQNYSIDKATQTEIPLREVLVEIHDWYTCLNAFCFCIVLLCMNLLYFQWLYTTTKLTRV